MQNILSFSGLMISFLGIMFIIVDKVPDLLKINPKSFKKKTSFLIKIKPFSDKIILKINSFSFYGMLHKVLSKIKVLNLKAEKITDFWLTKVRKKHIEKKETNKEIK